MLKIGHRGAPGNPRYGENTFTSFRKAIWSGADAIELDVRKTKDNTLVVIHDLALDRTTGSSGNVCDFNYDELKKLDAGFGDCIPMLVDAVYECFGMGKFVNIEIKESDIVGRITGAGIYKHERNHVILSAFDKDDNDPDSSSSWAELTRDANGFNFALLATRKKIFGMGNESYIKTAKEVGAIAIHPEYTAVNSEMMELAREAGLLVNVWTVNSFEWIESMRRLGVNGICSDFPERL
ncbi:MAG: glycerophosphodiester phosphodiesterase family protein [bacterium]|nr:glycerophosphodiester phosphodiesterase family protein [bacterium]